MENEEDKIEEKIKLLKHCFYYDALGEDESLKFLNEKLEANAIKKVNTINEAAYILTNNELESVVNGISTVHPFKGRFFTFKNKHLYFFTQQESAEKILAEVDRSVRVYKEKVWSVLKILLQTEKMELKTLKEYVSQVINSTIDYNQLLGELQNNYGLINASIDNKKIFWRIPNEIKPLIKKQIEQFDEYNELLNKIPKISEEKDSLETKKGADTISLKPKGRGDTFIDLSEVLDLIQEDKISLESEIKEPKKIKKKIEKSQVEGKSITVEGNIKKILKNDITFKTADGQEVRFTCNRPEIIAYCIGHINKQLRFYFDVKASELVCQKVEVSE